MKLFNRKNTNPVPEMLIVDEADLHPWSKWTPEGIEIDTHPGEPFDNPMYEQDSYYCGICGRMIPIEEYRTHTH